MQRDTIEKRTERQYDQDKQHKAGEGAKSGWTPAANGGDSEHDGQSFHCLDQRGQECRRHCRPHVSQATHHNTPPRECRQIFRYGPLLTLLLGPIELVGRLAVIATRVRLHDARVHGKPLALDQAHRHRRHDDALEDVA
jgi:hypothetical protein